VNVCDASHASTAWPSRARRDADAAPLYHRGFGRFLGHTFLLIAHQGRMTGKRRETVAMALTYDPETREAVCTDLSTAASPSRFRTSQSQTTTSADTRHS
jgi:hypothetical protein